MDTGRHSCRTIGRFVRRLEFTRFDRWQTGVLVVIGIFVIGIGISIGCPHGFANTTCETCRIGWQTGKYHYAIVGFDQYEDLRATKRCGASTTSSWSSSSSSGDCFHRSTRSAIAKLFAMSQGHDAIVIVERKG
mmetsp:Transcript_117053/g.174902  ORF Transcript_117053/g.174902 Transcript_117053/m.174902 type:complete len:134 (+) Transcript_117053:192-593(+)